MTKEEKFNDLIFKSFKGNDHYESIKYGMNRARSLMLKHIVFENASAHHQYDMCMTIYIIATQSSSKTMYNFRIIKRPEERIFEYALDEGFKPSESIDCTEVKILK